MKIEYAIIIRSKTRLELLIERFNTRAQAEFYITQSGGDFNEYELEHKIFYQSLEELQRRLGKVIKYKIIDRSFLPSFIFSPNQLIIVIGQDGLVANTAKYANGVPIVAVNPDRERYDGILLPYTPSNFLEGIAQVLGNELRARTVRFAEVNLNSGQRLLAFNDLFIGASSHVSARYRITYNGTSEEHSSSGIIVSTPAGSTGWLSSVFNMAYGITGLFEERKEPRLPTLREEQLLFAVREPFASIRSQTGLVCGTVNQTHPLVIESRMPSGGIIFSDGIESDFLSFNSGAVATISVSQEIARLVN
ncbi:MAG: sugar kinase [Saprospiraceae bacterium]|nr:sugar kinase [Lewinella sp.]